MSCLHRVRLCKLVLQAMQSLDRRGVAACSGGVFGMQSVRRVLVLLAVLEDARLVQAEETRQ